MERGGDRCPMKKQGDARIDELLHLCRLLGGPRFTCIDELDLPRHEVVRQFACILGSMLKR
jgi:hypothetical protein